VPISERALLAAETAKALDPVAAEQESSAPCQQPNGSATVGNPLQPSTAATSVQRAAIYARVSTVGNRQQPRPQSVLLQWAQSPETPKALGSKELPEEPSADRPQVVPRTKAEGERTNTSTQLAAPQAQPGLKTAKAPGSEAPAESSAVRPQLTPVRNTAGERTHPSTRPSYPQPRAAIYARVSTHNGQDPEMQLREVREYCARRGWQVSGEYVDRGISGSKERRPELDRLLADCRKRRVDAVVVYRYDRFARSLRQLVNALEEFRGLGIDFVSLHEGVDTSNPKWPAGLRHLCHHRGV
jgi:hypothetical protein